MNSEQFKKLLDELDDNSLQTLKEKNARYAKDGDCLHNFKVGAELMNCTTAQACWNYMSKHLAELWGKIETNDFSNREDFLEKCQDTINYIRFLWCIGNEEIPIVEEKSGETTDHWWYKPRFYNIGSADAFIAEMNRIFRERGGLISRADVFKYCGAPVHGSDRAYGWFSTDNWKYTEVNDEIKILIPRPVSIEHLL